MHVLLQVSAAVAAVVGQIKGLGGKKKVKKVRGCSGMTSTQLSPSLSSRGFLSTTSALALLETVLGHRAAGAGSCVHHAACMHA